MKMWYNIIVQRTKGDKKMKNVSYQELLQLAYERINEKLFEEKLTDEHFSQLAIKEIEIWDEMQKIKQKEV